MELSGPYSECGQNRAATNQFRRRHIMKKRILALGTAAVLALSLTACGSSQKAETTAAAADTTAAGSAAADTTAASGEKTVIKLGVVGENNEQWQPVIEKLAEENIDLELVKFADYPLPNRALNDGEIDFNVEQHTAYAENFNEAQKGNLVPISPIPTVLAAIFSATETSLDAIQDGAKVAVPDDAANTARAYVLLQKAGWITLNPDVDLSTVTQADITENPYNIEFTEMNSTNIPAVLDDFDYAVITGSIVYNAGIDPSTALLQEDILPHLILQVVVKEENKDAQWAKDIVAAYHSDEFKEYLDKNNNGLWFVPEELFN